MVDLQKHLIVGLIVTVGLCLPLQARTFTGQVVRVTDGDTLWVQTRAHEQPRKVRLQGLDAPEICQSWGPEARSALAGLVLHQSVQLDSRARDDYGRMLARVQVGGMDAGRWMVAQGHAWSYGYRHRAGPYANEQEAARASRLGLWAQAAVEPRQFRRQHGSCRQ